MWIFSFILIFSLGLEAVAAKKKDCAAVLEEVSSESKPKGLQAAKTEIAELMLERARLGDTDTALKSLLQKNIKQKIKEFKDNFGVELDSDEIKKIIEQIEKGSLKKEKKELKKEQKVRTVETETIMKWRRQRIHKEVNHPGPFINDSQFFTDKDKNLAIYDIKEMKYIWDGSLKDGRGQGQEVSWKSELLLTPQKDLLVIVNPDSVGLLDTKTGDYRNGTVKTKLDRGFRFAKISQDGKHLFLGGEDGESIIYELPSLGVVFGATRGDYPHGKGIVESPDGRYVFFIRSDGNQVLFDLQTKKEIRLPELKSSKFHHCYDAIFSKDSKTLTIANHNSWFLDFDILAGTLKPSKYKSNGKHLFTTVDGEYVIVGRDTAYPEGKDERPFTILEASTGKDVTPDMSQFDIDRVTQLWVFPEHSKLVFQDSIRQLGAQHPDHNYLYMVDLKSLEVSRYEYDPKLFVMGISEFTPDGQSLLTTGNGGPIIEFH